MSFKKEKIGEGLILAVFILTILLIIKSEPIAQDLTYHRFSDIKAFFYLPNTLNVLSNIPFIVVGMAGVLSFRAKGTRPLAIIEENKQAYRLLFWGTVFVGAGSGYYHLSPSNDTLVWDRIPMTIVFMSLYSIIVSEFVSERLGRRLLFPLITLGIVSVLYWWNTEKQGTGDLRWYAIVQFFPILTIPIILMCYQSRFSRSKVYWVLILSYVAAKLAETFDAEIYSALVVISGHSIKHLLPAMGLYYLIRVYKARSQN